MMLDLDRTRVAEDLNRVPFLIRHHLAEHPAFALESLVELANRLPPGSVEYNAGDLPLTQDPRLTPHNGLSIDETIRRISECRSWMVLKRVEADAQYRRILDECLDQIQPFAPGMRGRVGFVFISSPGSVTPYHMDHEYNFLLQLRGEKSMKIFERATLTELQIERFYRGDHRNLVYDQKIAGAGRLFELRPGYGVHVPVNAPHYVKNGPLVSVSFSITFRTPEGDRRSSVYCVNQQLRRWGLAPRPVGAAPMIDHAKYVGFALCARLRKVLIRAREIISWVYRSERNHV